MNAAGQIFSPQHLYDAIHDIDVDNIIAVGLSGGPDSMALVWLFSQLYAEGRGPAIEAVTIDHNLRPDSAGEAQVVGAAVRDWPGVTHSILTRPKPDASTRIQETARADRYAMLEAFCREKNISRLFTAHHRDDQAETFLMRLAAGSGLDGLAGMRPVSVLPSGLRLCRPLLGVSKQDLVAVCQAHGLPYVEDSSNRNERFARVRLRAAAESLEREGLSSERLKKTAWRLRRAQEAIDYYAEKLWDDSILSVSTDRVVFKYALLQKAPDEIQYRILKKAIVELRNAADEKQDYGPRMDRLEELTAQFFTDAPIMKATLGGCLIVLRLKADELSVEREG